MSVKENEKLHALSIHMKYGEVLHLDDISMERRDEYLKLCKETSSSILVEDDESVRNVLGKDIAKISVKTYSRQYREYIFPIKKALMSESILGKTFYSWIIKLFFIISSISIFSILFLKTADGTIIDTLFDSKMLAGFLEQTLRGVSKVYTFAIIGLLLGNIIDYALSLKTYYPVNQDGAEPAEHPRYAMTIMIIVFILVYTIAVRSVSAIFLL